jgi:hypothetical protein
MSAAANLLARAPAAKPDTGQPSPTPPAQSRAEFWREFLRVQCDKFILFVLIIFLWKINQFDDMKYVIGGLIVAINHNRFRWS